MTDGYTYKRNAPTNVVAIEEAKHLCQATNPDGTKCEWVATIRRYFDTEKTVSMLLCDFHRRKELSGY